MRAMRCVVRGGKIGQQGDIQHAGQRRQMLGVVRFRARARFRGVSDVLPQQPASMSATANSGCHCNCQSSWKVPLPLLPARGAPGDAEQAQAMQ